MTATTERCPGCHGSGIEMSGAYSDIPAYVGCHECSPECPQDCGCRVDAEPEGAESGVGAHPGAELSPSGYPSDPLALKGPQNRVEREPVLLGYDAESRLWRLLADKAALLGDVDRLTAERDRARLMRVIATRAFETTRRVLQEASGLPDDIDDPDCRDEMVLALRPRAEKAEAEVEQLRQSRDTWERVEAETRAEMHTRLAEHRDAVEVLKLRLSEVAAERDRARSVAVALEAEVERLRAGIEERVVGWSSYRTDPASLTAASCAESLRRLLTPPDAQEPAQEPRTGAGGPGVPAEGCEAVSGQQWGVVEAPQDGGE